MLLYCVSKRLHLEPFIVGREITKLQDLDLRNRLVSFIHGLGVIALTLPEFLNGNPVCGELNTAYQRRVLIFSASYFVYDTLAMIYEGLMDKAMMLHHPLSITGLLIPLIYGNQANYTMWAMFITEISNPAMHTRHLIRLSGRIHTKSYELAEVTFIILYIYARFFAVAPVIYLTLTCGENHIILKMACIGLLCQSIFFIFQMYKTMYRRYSEVLARKNHKIKLNWFTPLDKMQQEELELIYKRETKNK